MTKIAAATAPICRVVRTYKHRDQIGRRRRWDHAHYSSRHRDGGNTGQRPEGQFEVICGGKQR